jgi:hypothetical protein
MEVEEKEKKEKEKLQERLLCRFERKTSVQRIDKTVRCGYWKWRWFEEGHGCRGRRYGHGGIRARG